ncbi:CBASS cGAMP-activated phospholipase [Sutcliffiella cohnii]|uniref:Patatin n=1 Tax=Sutcliffiella cohnii TaxID=33932 RepID=A0A223KRA0_9BACI|nr:MULTISPECIES: CBASS cGAMP-activated phospholipase [Sutcliffiella]AST91868.1 patatin [Sutcliffiella cohnii]WBL13095.1 CBASS cGAMP-activated phospholipase [Sutcliffiella sp. NC1]
MKMLSIDGGGIRGVFAIAILQEIENKYKKPIYELFDCFAGTSTGSIIAASITCKISMDKLMASYKKYGKKIFVKQAKVGFFKSIYSDRYLRRFFQKAFGDLSLSDIQKPLLIPAVDITHGKPFVHRSNFGFQEETDNSVQLWDAVLSSCSAPVYFPPNNINNRYLSIDGGLWANNPSLVCMTEALHHFQQNINEINILSLGTGQQKIDFSISENIDWGIKQWLPFQLPSLKITPKLLDLALHLSSESVSYHCQLLLGSQYLRLNAELGEEMPFDDIEFIEQLIALGKEVYSKEVQIIQNFIESN